MAFIYDRLTEEKGSWIARSAVCDEYEAYWKENGRQPLGKAKFIPEMKRKGYDAVKRQGIYSYKGLRLKEEEFHHVSEDEKIPFG